MLNRIARRATIHGRPIRLTPLQFDLLTALMPGGEVSAETLWRQVWGLKFDPGTNRIAVHIHHIRRALLDAGGGYRLFVSGRLS